jgi:hypothetical protein
MLAFEARAKWDAWQAVRAMSGQEARDRYIGRVMELCPGWIETLAVRACLRGRAGRPGLLMPPALACPPND